MTYVSERECDWCRKRAHVGYREDDGAMVDTGMPKDWEKRDAVMGIFPKGAGEKHPEHFITTTSEWDLCAKHVAAYDAVMAAHQDALVGAMQHAIWKSRGVEPCNTWGSDRWRAPQPYGQRAKATEERKRAEVKCAVEVGGEEMVAWYKGDGYRRNERDKALQAFVAAAKALAWMTVPVDSLDAVTRDAIKCVQSSDMYTVKPLPADAKFQKG